MSPILGIWASAASANLVTDTGSYFPLGEFTLAAAQSSITFDNIPQTYKHLQLRYFARAGGSGGGENIYLRLNGNTTVSNYARHDLAGTGSSVIAQGGGSSDFYPTMVSGGQLANVYAGGIIDFLDYTNTNKNRTMRILNGFDVNGTGGWVGLSSMLYLSTTAVSSIFMSNWANSFAAGSHFALYGVL